MRRFKLECDMKLSAHVKGSLYNGGSPFNAHTDEYRCGNWLDLTCVNVNRRKSAPLPARSLSQPGGFLQLSENGEQRHSTRSGGARTRHRPRRRRSYPLVPNHLG